VNSSPGAPGSRGAGEPGASLPPPPRADAASDDPDNRSRHERHSLRWVAGDAETLC